MNISSVEMSGAMAGSSATVNTPGQTPESFKPAQAAGRDEAVTIGQVKAMVADMQGQLDSMNISLQYTLYGAHESKIAVKVVNKDTGNVIREIPPKEMQALQSKMSELVGMIFNEKG